jgi:hypothetical protein
MKVTRLDRWGRSVVLATGMWWLGGAGCSHQATPATSAGTGGVGAGGASAAGGASGDAGPVDTFASNRTPNKLDLLFMIDDSGSMKPLQAKLTARMPDFIAVLKDPTTGALPDLQIAVISSSVGAGAWDTVPGCNLDGHPGNDQGKFQQGPGGAGHGTCAMLHAGEKFLKSGAANATPNYDGDLVDAFTCMALLGDTGCGFEAQFLSTGVALTKASDPSDPDNGGFLRADALLAIVMLTNEDDCSLNTDSLLADPHINSVTDPSGLGALQSYRCNEFGHLCDGVPPPHDPPQADGGVLLSNCVSAEDMGKTDPLVVDPNGNLDPSMGHLYPTVEGLTTFVRSLKSDPDDILVAALAGPPTPYRVIASENPSAENELDPVVDHSCTLPVPDGGFPEYADPAVRIAQWISQFGDNGLFSSICADDFQGQVIAIGTKIRDKLRAP